MEKRQICIIGAGVAGLRCAAMLAKDPRFDVTILEARDRVGGRIAQDSRLGIPIDMGANWIHDVAETLHGDANPITALCSKLRMETHKWNDTSIIIDRNGQALPEAVSDQALLDLWDIWGEAAKFSRKHFSSKSVSSKASLKDHLVEQIEYRFPPRGGEQERDSQGSRQLMLDLIESWGTYTGEAVHDQSLRYYYIEACDESDEFVIDTFRPMIDVLLSEALEAGARLQLNTEMVSLRAKPAISQDASPGVSVETKNRSTLQFDHVVLTAPLGWLKKNAARCIDPLDTDLAASIQRSYFGRLEKILVKFPKAFWDDGREEPLSFLQWLPSEQQPWKMEAISMAAFSPPKNAPILMFYIFGDCSAYVCQQSNGKSKEEQEQFLKDLMMPYISCIPGYGPSCEPSQFLNSNWCSDELSLGSYTTFTTGCENGAEDIDTMRRGMPECGLWLAGEHTAPLDGVGSVYGAYASGEAVAERMLAHS